MKDECPALEVEEQEFTEKIKELEDECNMKAVKEDTPRAVHNGGVHFSANVQISNSTKNVRSGDKLPKANGIVKPRKSVMFVESH